VRVGHEDPPVRVLGQTHRLARLFLRHAPGPCERTFGIETLDAGGLVHHQD